MLRHLLPESLFPRKLSADTEQRLRLAQARADEAIVRAHVENALLFVEALAPEVPFERALEIYVRDMAIPEPAAGIVVTRALVALGDGILAPAAAAPPVPARPRLRLDEAAERRKLA
jgi:hypothetical protein